MYGVTMQEPGVSKLVSVKFQHAAAQPRLDQPACRREVVHEVHLGVREFLV
jgi:hypothetical protein